MQFQWEQKKVLVSSLLGKAYPILLFFYISRLTFSIPQCEVHRILVSLIPLSRNIIFYLIKVFFGNKNIN